MPVIELKTKINAPCQRCFDLSRSIDLHKASTAHTQEEAIAGKTSGLIALNETVTWRAKHFGFWHKLTSKITEFDSPHYFVDEQEKGIFHSFRHEHHFEQKGEMTIMTDIFQYKSPLGILGELADRLFLENYMRCFLEVRNLLIKQIAESEEWKRYIKGF